MRRVHNINETYNKLLNKLSNERDMEQLSVFLKSFKQKREDFNNKVENNKW